MTAADTDVRQVEKMFAVNVIGPMRMVHHFHRMVVASKGVVVNIGSVGGIVPYIYGGEVIYCYDGTDLTGIQASYNASKAALHHYGNTLRAEMKPFGVRVVNVISGEVGTNILKSDKTNGRRLPEGKSTMTILQNSDADSPEIFRLDLSAPGSRIRQPHIENTK